MPSVYNSLQHECSEFFDQTALGAMLIMWSAAYFTFRTLGLVVALAVLASALFLLCFPEPAVPMLGLRQIFGGTFRSVVHTCRQPQVLTGFLLFLAVVGTLFLPFTVQLCQLLARGSLDADGVRGEPARRLTRLLLTRWRKKPDGVASVTAPG